MFLSPHHVVRRIFLTPLFLSLLWSERVKPVLAVQPPTLTLASQKLWLMVVSKGCMASGNWSPCGSQTSGMVAGGSSRQGADEVSYFISVPGQYWFHASWCYFFSSFPAPGFDHHSHHWEHQCNAHVPHFLPETKFFVCQGQGGNTEQTPTSQTFNTICFKVSGKLYTILSVLCLPSPFHPPWTPSQILSQD